MTSFCKKEEGNWNQQFQQITGTEMWKEMLINGYGSNEMYGKGAASR